MARHKFIKSRRKYHKKNPFNLKLKKQTVYTVGAIWMWLFAGAITLSFFSEGTMFTKLREELLFNVGWTMYGLPPLLVAISLQFFKFKTKPDIAEPHVPLGLALILVASTALLQGGIIGAVMWNTPAGFLSTEGALLLYLALFIVGVIVLFNTSLDLFVNVLLNVIQGILDRMAGVFTKDGKRTFPKSSTTPLKIRGVEDEKFSSKFPPIIHPSGIVKQTPSSGSTAAPSKIELKINNALAPQDMTLWEYPPLSLLSEGPSQKADRGDMHRNADIIEKTLDGFGIQAHVKEVNPGPAVTQYALEIALGTKVSKITSLSSDLALALAAPTGQVRIEAPMPGRSLVGVEIPNRGLEFVTLKRMLQSEVMHNSKSKLAVALGLDVSGNPVIADIAKMPHVLIAGTTGSGKSVLVNAFITSLLFRTTPAEIRLIMVDPKRVELSGYNGIPHLLTPVIVEPDKILSALRWATTEMDHRYKQFAEVGARNIDGFNDLSGFQAMPYIVILIDELADLMAYAPVEVEDSICRIAQMARATGIHLVLATQRPSVDVITGLIKANIPSRIAFNVSSMIDSRVIIDTPGAEKLLGRGDMLYVPPDQSKPSRIQGTFVSDQEVGKVVEFLKTKNTPVNYTEEVVSQQVTVGKKGTGAGAGSDGKDPLFVDALRLICQHDKASASLLQRRLSVGYARAARILDQLEENGIIGPGEGSKPRDVIVKNAEEYIAQQAEQAQ